MWPDADHLRVARQICDDAGALLIFDEVQTGFVRTGKWFGKDHLALCRISSPWP